MTEVINELLIEEGVVTNDSEIAVTVNNRLREESQISNQAVRVDCLNGTVTLSGYVSNSDQIQMAGDVAIGVAGVRLINNLLIANPDRVVANLEHANVIRAEVERTIGLDLNNFLITIVDETARISGSVDDIWKKEEIEKIVRKHQIISVANDIVV